MDHNRSVAQEITMPSRTGPRSPLGAAVCHLLDALDHAALIFDARGALLHETRAYRALAARETDSLALRRAARELALDGPATPLPATRSADRPTVSASQGADDVAPRRVTRPVPETRVVCDRYTLRRLPVPLAKALTGGGPEVVVIVVESRPVATDEALRTRYGLTPRELMVAQLIADGLPTPRIASALGVSVHTVRRHSERIFRKLGVTTRAAVSSRVLAAQAGASRTSARDVGQTPAAK